MNTERIIAARKRYDELRAEVRAYAASPTGQLAGCAGTCRFCMATECAAGDELLALDDFLYESDYDSEDEQDDEDDDEDEACWSRPYWRYAR
jgi:hypothetical protein